MVTREQQSSPESHKPVWIPLNRLVRGRDKTHITAEDPLISFFAPIPASGRLELNQTALKRYLDIAHLSDHRLVIVDQQQPIELTTDINLIVRGGQAYFAAMFKHYQQRKPMEADRLLAKLIDNVIRDTVWQSMRYDHLHTDAITRKFITESETANNALKHALLPYVVSAIGILAGNPNAWHLPESTAAAAVIYEFMYLMENLRLLRQQATGSNLYPELLRENLHSARGLLHLALPLNSIGHQLTEYRLALSNDPFIRVAQR